MLAALLLPASRPCCCATLQGRRLLNPSTLTCHLVAAEYEAVKEETWSSKDMLQVSNIVG